MWCSSRTNPSTMLQDVMFLRYSTSVFINITLYLKMWCPSRTNPNTMLYFTNTLSFMHFTIFLNGCLGHLMPNNGIYFYHFNGINHNTRLIPDRAMTLSMYRSYAAKARWVISTVLPSIQHQSDIHSSLPSIRHYDHRVFIHIPLLFFKTLWLLDSDMFSFIYHATLFRVVPLVR